MTRLYSGASLRDAVLSRVIPFVQTPAQYLGGELNSVDPLRRTDSGGTPGRFCMIFPDLYTIGMSCHALQVLYALMNRQPDWICERAFAPWPDMEAKMREASLPWYSLETFTPLSEFDVLGFTLQSELVYTGVLTILDLGGVPLHSEDRTLSTPLVVAGGPCAWNPEPMARFVDLFMIGDGEEVLPRVCRSWREVRQSSTDRADALRRMAELSIPGVFVPSCYTVHCDRPDPSAPPVPITGKIPASISPAIVPDLNEYPLPTSPVVPFVDVVQDRIAIEVMRGCPHRCRFCQSRPIRHPVRYRSIDTIVTASLESFYHTGSDEISLLSLSTSDYPRFRELMCRMQEVFRPHNVAISVPSLRVNEQLAEVGDLVTNYRRSGLTLAPEAATETMRIRIGKDITDADLDTGCRRAFAAGFNRVKLYFMCGLPGESDSDVESMIDVAERISRIGKEVSGRFPQIVVSCSNFIPKPHTPFQWVAMRPAKYFRNARAILKNRNRYRSITVKTHDADSSILEGLLSRGDRRMGDWIESVWRTGARFESWSEYSEPQRWWEAMADHGIDPERFLHTEFPVDRRLPWDFITIRQGREYLEQEYAASRGDGVR
ncbi:MAG: TIGR03960 family B12-binding radical SAM protein [Planctomycetia bacterium]|nr:TIGR03960 family B12-binding radical SAM protein [Planctomycetia bacterium]